MAILCIQAEIEIYNCKQFVTKRLTQCVCIQIIRQIFVGACRIRIFMHTKILSLFVIMLHSYSEYHQKSS